MNSTEKKDVRIFGTIALVFFGGLCLLGILLQRSIPVFIFGTLAVIGLAFILFPGPMKPVHRGWLFIARILGGVLTVFMLTLAYYLVITPSGLLKRVFGGRPLPLRPDRKALSYWVAREETLQPRERFFKRY